MPNYEELRGIITRKTPFGAFMYIGQPPGYQALVHISEVPECLPKAGVPGKDIEEVFQLGQEVTCRIIGIDDALGRITLSRMPKSP